VRGGSLPDSPSVQSSIAYIFILLGYAGLLSCSIAPGWPVSILYTHVCRSNYNIRTYTYSLHQSAKPDVSDKREDANQDS
jgi:hypothetical protein